MSKKHSARKKVSRSRIPQHKTVRPHAPLLMIGVVAAVVVILIAVLISRQPRASSVAAKGTLPLEVSVSEAAALRDAGAFIIDVREPHEWLAGHIPGAAFIPLGELAARVDEVPADRQIVVMCRSANRSAVGRKILQRAGLEQVTSMAGGMNEWAAEGYAIVTGP